MWWRLKSKPGLTGKYETLFKGMTVRRQVKLPHGLDWNPQYQPSSVPPRLKAQVSFSCYSLISKILFLSGGKLVKTKEHRTSGKSLGNSGLSFLICKMGITPPPKGVRIT